MKLERTYRNYMSKYSMVTFSENMPYEYALKKGRAQDQKLMEICSGIDSVDEIELKTLYEDLKKLEF